MKSNSFGLGSYCVSAIHFSSDGKAWPCELLRYFDGLGLAGYTVNLNTPTQTAVLNVIHAQPCDRDQIAAIKEQAGIALKQRKRVDMPCGPGGTGDRLEPEALTTNQRTKRPESDGTETSEPLNEDSPPPRRMPPRHGSTCPVRRCEGESPTKAIQTPVDPPA